MVVKIIVGLTIFISLIYRSFYGALIMLPYLSGKVIDSNLKDPNLYKYNWFFWIVIFGTYFLMKFRYTLESILVYIIGNLLTIMYIFKYVPLDTYFTNSIMIGLFWTVFVITSMTLYAIMISLYFYNKISNRDPPMGDKGEIGERGDQGKPSNNNLSPSSLCLQQLMNDGNNLIVKNKILRKVNFDHQKKYMNNLFIKDNYDRICKSKEFNNLVEERGTINAVKHMQHIVKRWINIILKYRNGELFLEDPFYSDEHWVELLTNNRNIKEKISPIEIIKKDKVWNWGKCN